jgi:tetratricopeptide (TPR) repeat protein
MTLSRSDAPRRINLPIKWSRSNRATVSPSWVIAMLGIAATALSSFACSPEVPAQPPGSGQNAAKASAVSRTVSVAPDDAETRTPLFLLRTRNEGGNEAKATPVVTLGRPVGGKNKEDTQRTVQGILERELIRQALLIAVRDELGLSTRDQILEESSPAEVKERPSAEPVEIAILFRPAECRALVRRGEGDKVTILQKHDLGTNPDAGNYSAKLTTTAELLSRTEFPSLLKQLGATGAPNRVRDDASLPPDVENRLASLSMVDVFAAVRMLHDAIRADGESPERLAALARGYAQLGMLSEFFWSPAHRAYKARALLYAERLNQRSGGAGSAQALYARAFVRALVGRHDLALRDLDAAAMLQSQVKGQGANSSPAPSWLPVIDAYLKADRKRLAVKEGPHAKLARLLDLMVVEYPPHTRLLIQTARDVINTEPDCYRPYDLICVNGDFGDVQLATASALVAFPKLFPLKLRSLATLPESVKKPLDQGDDEVALVRELEQAGRAGQDAGEPSWSALAHLARETRFVHVFRRLRFMARKWNVPVGAYFDAVRPLVAEHPYFPLLESYVLPRDQGDRALTALADRLDITNIEPTARFLIDALRDLDLPAGRMAGRQGLAHRSILARDFAELIRQTNDRMPQLARVLLNISPYSSYAMATLIASDWDRIKCDVPAWREKVGDAPGLLGALGKKYAELKQYDEAEHCLKRYVELSGDEWAYQELAACYEARGDRDRAKATIGGYLNNTESGGRQQHAQVQAEIANKLMKEGRWQEAKPYAESAADTGAAFGMECASACAEGLKEWDQAELWMKRISERYPKNGWPRWYIFCKRTGHGDLASARALADAHLQEIAGQPETREITKIGFFYWSAGSQTQALEYMDKAYQVTPSTLNGFARVLLADELGQNDRRDRMLDEMTAQFQGKVPRMVSICKLMHDSLAAGRNQPLDLAAVDKVLDQMPAKNRLNADFFVGRFLVNRHRLDAARKYLKRCGDQDEAHIWPQLLAIDALRSADQK